MQQAKLQAEHIGARDGCGPAGHTAPSHHADCLKNEDWVNLTMCGSLYIQPLPRSATTGRAQGFLGAKHCCEYEVDVDLEKRLVDQRCYRTPEEYMVCEGFQRAASQTASRAPYPVLKYGTIQYGKYNTIRSGGPSCVSRLRSHPAQEAFNGLPTTSIPNWAHRLVHNPALHS